MRSFAIWVGPRKQKLKEPVNLSSVYIGTGLLWFGWLGFNGKLIFKYEAVIKSCSLM